MKRLFIMFMTATTVLVGCSSKKEAKEEIPKEPINISVEAESNSIGCEKYISRWEGHTGINEEDYLTILNQEIEEMDNKQDPIVRNGEKLDVVIENAENMPEDVYIEKIAIFNDYKKDYASKVEKYMSKNTISFEHTDDIDDSDLKGYIYTVIMTWEQGVCRYVFSCRADNENVNANA